MSFHAASSFMFTPLRRFSRYSHTDIFTADAILAFAPLYAIRAYHAGFSALKERGERL